MRFLYLMALVSALWIQPLKAAGWQDISDEDYCGMGSAWELGTVVLIQKSKTKDVMEDDFLFSVSNENWSLKMGDKVDFELKIEGDDGESFWNTPVAMDNGLLMNSNLKFLRYFRTTQSVAILKDGQEIAGLKWGPFSYALSRFERCIAKVRAPLIEEERKRKLREARPIDPFATTKEANEKELKRINPNE